MPRIGIVTPYAANISPSGYYNRQDVGMAKALVELGHEVVLFKACDRRSAAAASPSLGPGIEEHALPSLVLGTHSLFRPSLLGNHRVDRFIVMSDMQVMVPSLFRWMRRNGLTAVAYIGILESHKGRSSPVYQWVLERNLSNYRRSPCYAKTPAVLDQLHQAGVTRATLLPVGLDRSLLAEPCSLDPTEAKRALGLQPKSRVLGYVGRLSEEKRPLQAVRVFQQLLATDPRWSFLLVGSGPLEREVLAELAGCTTGQVVHIPRLPQPEMVRAYRASDVLLNLCPTEIFGMTILESLYFGTPVVAVDAPGPRFIIREGLDGHLVPTDDPESLVQAVLRTYEHRESLAQTSRAGVLTRFDWKTNVLRSGILDAEP